MLMSTFLGLMPTFEAAAAATLHSWVNCQKPAKIKVEKFVKLTDHTCVCYDLTSFEYDAHIMTGNGSYLKMLEFAWKNSWNHIGQTYYRLVLAIWNHCGLGQQVAAEKKSFLWSCAGVYSCATPNWNVSALRAVVSGLVWTWPQRLYFTVTWILKKAIEKNLEVTFLSWNHSSAPRPS